MMSTVISIVVDCPMVNLPKLLMYEGCCFCAMWAYHCGNKHVMAFLQRQYPCHVPKFTLETKTVTNTLFQHLYMRLHFWQKQCFAVCTFKSHTSHAPCFSLHVWVHMLDADAQQYSLYA